MKIETLVVGPVATNCYLVSQEDRDDAIIIDPGAEGDRIKEALKGKKPAAILLTHGHFDHTGALWDFSDVPVYIHRADAKLLVDPALHAGQFFGDNTPRPEADYLLKDGEILHLAGFEIKVLHVPGHTPGGVCYEIEGKLFTGDTLFCRGYGRTDFPGGDFEQLKQSLRLLLRREKDAEVYPGHGGPTTIFRERGYL